MKYSTYFFTRKTSQSERIPGSNQVPNNAGGYAWAIDDWKRLDRFLILGSERGTYYGAERELTQENAEATLRCIKADGRRTVSRIVELSESGRAPKNDPALFALALAAALGDEETKRLAWGALPRVARIGTHLFHFVREYHSLRGWSRTSRRALAAWYDNKTPEELAYQVAKYQQRDGWSHRDILRLTHPKPQDAAHQEIYRWIVGKGMPELCDAGLRLLEGVERAKREHNPEKIAAFVRDYGLTWEMLPTEALNSATVWEALLEKMPFTAMVRNLAKMTVVGLVKPLSQATAHIVARLRDQKHIQKARAHPIMFLLAMRTYEQGHGEKGKLCWEPVDQIVDALDDAFYLAFSNVAPTGKRLMLAVDVSGSMAGSMIAGSSLTAREAAAAMALVTAKTENNYLVTAFSSAGDERWRAPSGWSFLCNGISLLHISPHQRLTDAVQEVSRLGAGGTDCALPMLYALERKLNVDTFIVYTDSETWAGKIHPAQALQMYRQKTGVPAKLVVVGMTSTGFSIADPNDPGMIDCVGFDASTPELIGQFVQGKI